MNPFKRSF